MARPSSAISRARGDLFGIGKPGGILEHGACMPSARARRVISFAKEFSSPAMISAIATAISFAERVTNALIASSTSMVCPTFSPSLDGGCAVASAEILIGELSFRRPVSSSENRR